VEEIKKNARNKIIEKKIPTRIIGVSLCSFVIASNANSEKNIDGIGEQYV
jgi:hypothetical protein